MTSLDVENERNNSCRESQDRSSNCVGRGRETKPVGRGIRRVGLSGLNCWLLDDLSWLARRGRARLNSETRRGRTGESNLSCRSSTRDNCWSNAHAGVGVVLGHTVQGPGIVSTTVFVRVTRACIATLRIGDFQRRWRNTLAAGTELSLSGSNCQALSFASGHTVSITLVDVRAGLSIIGNTVEAPLVSPNSSSGGLNERCR